MKTNLFCIILLSSAGRPAATDGKTLLIAIQDHPFLRLCRAWLTCISLPILLLLAGSGKVLGLPVYAYGVLKGTEAAILARHLGLTNGVNIYSNGVIQFLSRNYLSIPTTQLTDPVTKSNLLDATVNEFPDIPISLQQLDLNALNNLPHYDPNSAVMTFSNAIYNAYLLNYNGFWRGVPQWFYTLFEARYTNETGVVVAGSNVISTEISYSMYDTNGYPMVGAGMQVQAAFDDYGNCTRLLYSAPSTITNGPDVQIITSMEASNRVMNIVDPTGASPWDMLSLQIVYHVPRLWPRGCPQCGFNPHWIIPWYQAVVSQGVMDPGTLQTNRVEQTILVPATDDANFVPHIGLYVSTNGNQVYPYAAVTGGQPPYTYTWAGSDPNVSSNTGPSFAYTPVVQRAIPELNVSQLAFNLVTVWWEDPVPVPWIVEYRTNLALATGSNIWIQLPNSVQTNNGVYSVTVNGLASSMFFRLRAANPTVSTLETVTLIVTDANGVSATASQVLPVQAALALVNRQPPARISISYGCESPFDPGFGTGDRASWLAGMGTAGAGGGSEQFCWTGSSAWPGDFIEPPTPGSLPPHPWINGDADYANWGVNTANIVLYIGGGGPDTIDFSMKTQGSGLGSCLGLGLDTYLGTPGWGIESIGDCDLGNINYRLPDNYPGSWRNWGPNDRLDWLCMFSENTLGNSTVGNFPPYETWGQIFNGLHMMTGFHTLTWPGTGFPEVFADNLLGVNQQAETVVSAWMDASLQTQNRYDPQNGYTGRTSIFGPIGPMGVTDMGDYYWGKGAVGPTIKASQISGWWHIDQTP
jgi:Family of unknown function (DUF6345)